MTTVTSREVQLRRYIPQGVPPLDAFATVTIELPSPQEGQVLVRNTALSVDPYMRGRMELGRSYVAPYGVGEAMRGGAVGIVVESESPRFAVGQMVRHDLGWREYALLSDTELTHIDCTLVPDTAHLGILGMPGLTAYVGLTRMTALAPGETVFVSGAAGAVGSAAGQIAKLLGAATVIGAAGSKEKVRHLVDDLGFDSAFNYRDGSITETLTSHAPDGIDVYFENVGGELFEAALANMRDFGRIAFCGAISGYNGEGATAWPRNIGTCISRRIAVRGFIVYDHADLEAEYAAMATAWVASGQLTYRETVVSGFESTLDAFLGLFTGANTGKMVVRLDG